MLSDFILLVINKCESLSILLIRRKIGVISKNILQSVYYLNVFTFI